MSKSKSYRMGLEDIIEENLVVVLNKGMTDPEKIVLEAFKLSKKEDINITLNLVKEVYERNIYY